MNSFTTLFSLNSLANVAPAGENLQAIGGGSAHRCVKKVAGFPAMRRAVGQKNARVQSLTALRPGLGVLRKSPGFLLGGAPCAKKRADSGGTLRAASARANRWIPRRGHDRARWSLDTAPCHKKSATGNPLRFELDEEVKPRHPRPHPHRHGETTAEH